jgi:hypothetical protein
MSEFRSVACQEALLLAPSFGILRSTLNDMPGLDGQTPCLLEDGKKHRKAWSMNVVSLHDTCVLF